MNTDEFNSDDGDHLMAEISSDIDEEADQPIFDKNDLLKKQLPVVYVVVASNENY